MVIIMTALLKKTKLQNLWRPLRGGIVQQFQGLLKSQNLNTSGFNASTTGNRLGSGFGNEGHNLIFWSADDSSEGNSCELAWYRSLYAAYNYLDKNRTCKRDGGYVRLIKDSQFVTNAQILLNGTVSAENNQIKNVADPTDAQDAVTKTFIENFIKNSVSMEFLNGIFLK